MERSDFDTKDGIVARLGSYARLYEVLEARRRYYSENLEAIETVQSPGMALGAFYILGCICSDKRGNVIRLNPEVFGGARRARMSDVITEDEFLEFIGAEDIELGSVFSLNSGCGGCGCGCGSSCDTGSDFSLPPPETECQYCEQSWALNTLGDHVRVRLLGMEMIGDREGQTYGAVIEELSREYMNAGSWGVEHVTEGFQEDVCPILEEEEVETMRSRRPDWDEPHETLGSLVRPGDVLLFQFEAWMHLECLRLVQAEQEAEAEQEQNESLIETLETVGFRGVEVRKVAYPEHVVRWMMSEDDPPNESDLEQMAAECPYLRVSTDRWEFGILMTPMPLIDVTGMMTWDDVEDYSGEGPGEEGFRYPEGIVFMSLVPFIRNSMEFGQLRRYLESRQEGDDGGT